jgi:hypothetical protein
MLPLPKGTALSQAGLKAVRCKLEKLDGIKAQEGSLRF